MREKINSDPNITKGLYVNDLSVYMSDIDFILQSVLRHVNSFFQSEVFTGCDLVLPLSIYSIFSFP
jgi:hypothetical protein